MEYDMLTLFYTHHAIWHDMGYRAFKYEFGTFLYKSIWFIYIAWI